MKKLILTLAILLGCAPFQAHSFMKAKDTLHVIMQHIMHREQAAFMRFDQGALDMMKETHPLTARMKFLYETPFLNVYKASVQNEHNAICAYNPLFEVAQEDLNYCTRFLKILKKYTSLIITDKQYPEDMIRSLFKKGSLHVVINDQAAEEIGSLLKFCQSELDKIDGFTVVALSIRTVSPIIQQQLLLLKPNMVVIDLDVLFDVVADSKQTLIDTSRFYGLMKRNLVFMSTAALIPMKFEQRKEQYIHSIKVLNEFGYEPYVVESCSSGPSFLDDQAARVVYVETNDATLTNKGINEAKSLIAFFDACGDELNDDDIIIKLTGRYYLEDDSFIRLVEDSFAYDAFAMHGFQSGERRPYIDLYTGMFALKYVYFNNFVRSINFDHMKEHKIWFEWEASNYLYGLVERHVPVQYVDSLHMYHYIFRDSVNDVACNVADEKRYI